MNRKEKHKLTCKTWEKIRLVTVLKTKFVSTDESFMKSHHLFTLHFYTLLKRTAMQRNARSLPIS